MVRSVEADETPNDPMWLEVLLAEGYEKQNIRGGLEGDRWLSKPESKAGYNNSSWTAVIGCKRLLLLFLNITLILLMFTFR